MITVPIDIHARLIPYAKREVVRSRGIPQANDIKGRMIVECHPHDYHQGEAHWIVWSVAPGWFKRLPEWSYPLDDEGHVKNDTTGPFGADVEFARELRQLDVSCRCARVACVGHFLQMPDWLHLVSYARGPSMARLFYVDLMQFDALFRPGYSPNTLMRLHETITMSLGRGEPTLLGHHNGAEITAPRVKVLRDLWERRPRMFRSCDRERVARCVA